MIDWFEGVTAMDTSVAAAWVTVREVLVSEALEKLVSPA